MKCPVCDGVLSQDTEAVTVCREDNEWFCWKCPECRARRIAKTLEDIYEAEGKNELL